MTHLVWECTSLCYVTNAVRHPISIALYLYNLIQLHDLEMIYTHESVTTTHTNSTGSTVLFGSSKLQ